MTENKKVAIVGWASATRDKAPFKDESFDVWGCNELGKYIQGHRWTAWFQLHSRAEMLRLCPDRLEWLAAQTVPVYVFEPFPEVPKAILYPHEQICQQFRPYFNSTVDWMIALAIVRGYKEIHLYGVEMAMDAEWSHQKPSCSYWMGLAEGMGIKIVIPDGCSLLKVAYVYGLETAPEEAGPIPESLLRERLQVSEKKREEALRSALIHEGIMIGHKGLLENLIRWKRDAGLLPPAIPGVADDPSR